MARAYTLAHGRETEGERGVYAFFSKLSNQFHFWHGVKIRTAGIHTEIDFIVLHPRFGLWVVEVKDWLMSQILRVDTNYCVILQKDKEVTTKNPLTQAEDNHNDVKNLLAQHPELRHQNGDYRGKLILAVNYLVMLTNITQAEFTSANVGHAWSLDQVITADSIRHAGIEGNTVQDLLLRKRRRDIRFENAAGLTDQQLQRINQIFNPAFIARPAAPVVSPAKERESELIAILRDLVTHNDKLLQSMWRRS